MKNSLFATAALLLCSTTLFTSCAFHSGTYASSAVISSPHYKIRGVARGQANTTHFLGIGGLGQDGLVDAARNDLYAHTPLRPDMSLVNVTVDIKRSFFFILTKTTVFISGEILEYDSSSAAHKYNGFYTTDSTFFPTEQAWVNKQPYDETIAKTTSKYAWLEVFTAGDTVKFQLNNKEYPARIEGINNYGIRCSYQTNGVKRFIYLKEEQLYK